MLRWYGYLGIALIILAQLNFFAKIEPFATWYIPIVWYGYILFVDSLVYKVKKRSLISNYPKEFLFLVALSVLFWSIFELYNIFTLSWSYANYVWYVHFLDFTTIMPAVLETFSLFTALKLGKRFDIKKGKVHKPANERLIVKLLVIFGAFITISLARPVELPDQQAKRHTKGKRGETGLRFTPILVGHNDGLLLGVLELPGLPKMDLYLFHFPAQSEVIRDALGRLFGISPLCT
jgi:hypothetical protein